MEKEIERKYLVKKDLWESLTKPAPIEIKQGYLSNEIHPNIRIRTKGNRGFITIKSKTVGISRSEFEYEIPLTDANDMLKLFCPKHISKKRYEITIDQHTWEVDVFDGPLAPLIIAEIELTSENESFSLPDWVGREVSTDPSYYNAQLFKLL